ncbi:hypothetical protein NM208_g4657 [Fusarium decemcellulare]|uniref:Uncharacterized protein n=1 Tax=Fusarium decemcellulare TaxID=57161 RepID=A0ACC1SK15_9HYPO|nr:hypothetical protein NM208_g4657 [Fusarium decemcellulare]
MVRKLIHSRPPRSLVGGPIGENPETSQTPKPGIPSPDSKSTVLFESEGVRYVAFESIALEPSVGIPSRPSLVTVICLPHLASITKVWLQGYLEKLDDCDVYDRKSFLKRVIFATAQDRQTIPPECLEYLATLGCGHVEVKVVSHDHSSLVSGPYYYDGKGYKGAYRLYDDKQGAFLSTIKPSVEQSSREDIEFQQLEAAGSLYACLGVAVPPRKLALPASSSYQLRVAVKDCYSLKGLKTSLCNRDYYEMSNPATPTAEAVQALLKDGAHILGLTKLSSMVAREEPLDAVDFPTAFNPRGDGYQSPAGSSSGSAVAVAAYDWVDCALGTDTSGSGRRPAMVNGVWQYRPSHDFVSRKGLVKTYDKFDTPCLFTRRLDIIRRVMVLWLSSLSRGFLRFPSRRYNFVCPIDCFSIVKNRDQMKLIDSFMADVKDLLPAKVTQFDIRESWKQSPPSSISESVDEYLDDVIRRTYYHQFYLSSDNFRKSYAKKHGRPPYVIPFVHNRWDQGARVSLSEYEDATERLEVYKKWLKEQLFGDTNVETFVVLPVANAEPNYRDELSPSPEKQSALDQLFLPPILGSPDIVIPIGDVSHRSKISHRDEFLPVVVNLVGAPGRDFQLLQAVENIMEVSSRPTVVSTGPRMFPQ